MLAKPGGGAIDELCGATFWHFPGRWQWYIRVCVILVPRRAVIITGSAVAKGQAGRSGRFSRLNILSRPARFDNFSVAVGFEHEHPLKLREPASLLQSHAVKFDVVKTLQDFVAKTASEDESLFHAFSINEDQVFCREAYESANGLLSPLENVGCWRKS